MSEGASKVREPARRLADFIERRPWQILLSALVVGAIALSLALQLRVDQQLRALLPADAVSTTRVDDLADRLGNQSDLYVSIRSPSRDANLRFGRDLAAALRERPDIRYALFHLDRAFFERSALLYADLEDLLDLRCRVIEKIQAEVRRELALFPEDEGAPPAGAAAGGLSEAELRERYELDTRLPEYYEADEGQVVVIKARPSEPDTDIAFARRLFQGVDALARRLDPPSYHPAMEVTIEGSYAEHSRRVGEIQGDIVQGSAVVVGLLMLALIVYFRGARAIVLILVPLVIAVLTALAFARLVYHELNLVSAFIFVVLLGLGIDFGIHVLARYQGERRRGLALGDALAVTLSTTCVSTAAGALSTALTCFLLVVADFRGFSQFGVVAGVGVVLALAGAVIVLPAMLVILERLRPWRAINRAPAVAAALPPPAPRGDRPGVPWLALAILALGLGGAGFGAAHLGDLEFEYDLGRLDQPVNPPEEAPKAGPEPFRRALGKTTTAPAVALTDDLADTRDVHRQLAALHRLSADEVALLADGGELPLPPALDACGRPLGDPAAPDADDEVVDDEDDDTRDPAFVALAERARRHRALDPEVRAHLARYPGARLREMDDRLTDYASVYTYVPELQAEKLQVIRDIRRRIAEKAAVLSPADQERLRTWEPYLAIDREIGAADLPEWVRVQFTDEHGQLGRFVVFWTRGGKADYRNSKRIYDAYLDLEAERGAVPVAASFFVIPEIVDTIAADGPVVLALACGVLVVIAVIIFRGAVGALIILGTVALALVWLGGLLYLIGWKVNFFNVIAFPLLIGMGQDDAVHLLHRAREGSPLALVLRETGGAIFMTTLTTVLGYGGMLFADHLGLFSLGLTAASGMVLCLLASVAVLPAALRVAAWLRGRRG